jgi:hypothetical protein
MSIARTIIAKICSLHPFGHGGTPRRKCMHLLHLGDNLFRRVLLPWHVLILLDAIRHPSSRITSAGVDQVAERDALLQPRSSPRGGREWGEDYNTERPHSSLPYEIPVAYAVKFTATDWYARPLRGSAC